MAPLPKRKHSSMRQGKRRSAISLSLPDLIPCANCGALKYNHIVCPKCGFYNGRQIIKTATKEKKKNENPS